MIENKKNNRNIEPGQNWEVDLFRPEDAEGVTQLFLEVYGKGYPIETYINPGKLIEENARGRTISSVTRTEHGDIVGHNAMYNSVPYEGIYESGAGLVHKYYRGGKGIFTKMVAHGMEMASSKFGFDGLYGESVCNHVFSQRLARGLGWITQAIEVDLMPATAYTKEKSAAGRVASLLEFLTLKPRPHRIFLPRVYEDNLRFIYSGLDDKREIMISDESLSSSSKTEINRQVFSFAQVARLAVMDTGDDFESAIKNEEIAVRQQDVLVIQVWLKLSSQSVGEAVDILRSRGYFIGGVLPRWFDDDGLLMQKIFITPSWEGMQIEYERARELLDRVRSDWADSDKRVAKEKRGAGANGQSQTDTL
ncbi:MAG TPA: hypothetical protein PK874_10780 [Desulfobacteraceae bacterium]|nr:hypothetical protein [Desulfobacteraceae bacterium]HPJ69146.1 hypothetical protein [Desulfobacteraceae bacterium]HPQ27731.1 hypothetical protein [Desulfobacteraceae bacterium]